MPEIISREEARALGLRRYFTGLMCLHGHLAERRTYSGECWECHRIRMKAAEQKPQQRARKRAQQKVRRSSPAYKASKRSKDRKYPRNLEKRRENNRKYYWRDPEKQRERCLNLYYVGPSNPEGELQWLSKAKALLRTAKRTLKEQRQEAHR